MPVTAKLSTRFYETFGDQIANELVDWFNSVDKQSQQQLREMNELNWQRFSAELRAESATIRAEVRLEIRTEITGLRVEFRDRIGALRAEVLKWMFIYWTGTVVTVGGMMVGLASLLR